jgi:SAM-dependent methyltransferase
MQPKQTTQKAPLESLLTHLRTQTILPHVQGQRVLDFGCGREARTLRAIRGQAQSLTGYDPCFLGQKDVRIDGIPVYGAVSELRAAGPFDRITSLACFEHIEPELLPAILQELATVTPPEGLIVGTVPAPPAKPVLELLSGPLRLLDRSQIADHKIYYSRRTLEARLEGTPWRIREYRRFQLGLNSFFVFSKKT